MVNRMESVVESDVKRELEDKRRSLNELIELIKFCVSYIDKISKLLGIIIPY